MKKQISILLAITVLFSCENELPFITGDDAPQLMVTDFLEQSTEDQSVKVSLSKDGSISGVGDATVHCYVNGHLVADTSVSAPDRAQSSRSHQLTLPFKACFSPGDIVRLEVEAEGSRYQVSTPDLPVPEAPDIRQADTVSVTVMLADRSLDVVRFMLDLKDSKKQNNWYALHIEKHLSAHVSFSDGSPDEDFVHRSIPRITYSSHADPVLLDGNLPPTDIQSDLLDYIDFLGDGTFAVFSDDLFRDQSTKISFDSYWAYFYRGNDEVDILQAMADAYGEEKAACIQMPIGEVRNEVYVKLSACSEESYHYLRALRTIVSNGYNPIFMEPVTIPGNINGGLGYVGVLSSATEAI